MRTGPSAAATRTSRRTTCSSANAEIAPAGLCATRPAKAVQYMQRRVWASSLWSAGAVIDRVSAEQPAAGPAPVGRRRAVPARPARERPHLAAPATPIKPRARLLERLFDGPGWIALRVATDLLMLVAASVTALALVPGDERPWALTLFA